MDRRTSLKYTAGLSAMISLGLKPWSDQGIQTRVIYSSGEKIPAVGLGTWRTFDAGPSESERAPLREVLRTLVKTGGSVVDSSPMYGRSEQVIGDLSRQLGISSKLFGATKVWTSGAAAGVAQMEQSMERMAKPVMDLMQVHNLVDWKTHLPLLFKWKEAGKVRYVGITHYLESAYPQMEDIMKNYPLDFVQLNYSITSRTAEQRLLPLARDKGIAVIINRPFEGGSLFVNIRKEQLPVWTADFDCHNWAQFFLKYILAHPAVTCAIPGTSQAQHLSENLGAGLGKYPDQVQKLKMLDHMRTI